MGLLDFLGGGKGPAKAQKLKAKVTQKYGDPTVRQKALHQLGEMKIPEAMAVLLSRFTVNVEPQTTDADEKEQAFAYITARGQDAVPPTLAFLHRTDIASSWALRILQAVLPEPEVVGLVTDYLTKLGPEYMRNPEKKLVCMNYLEGKADPRIAPSVAPLLEDTADDVKIGAAKVLGPLKYEPAREPMLKLLTGEETARRVQTALLQALHESELGIQGYREKVEKLLVEPYFLDKNGLVKRRG